MNAAIAHVHAIDDGIMKLTAVLDHSAAHALECRQPILVVNTLRIETLIRLYQRLLV